MEKKENKENIVFLQKYNAERDMLEVEISISDRLRDILKECSIEELTELDLIGIQTDTNQRYLIKRVINSTISNRTQLLFNNQLIDNKKLVVFFEEVRVLNNFIDNLKWDIQAIITTYFQAIKDKKIVFEITIDERERI